jgi:hypothetical protein
MVALQEQHICCLIVDVLLLSCGWKSSELDVRAFNAFDFDYFISFQGVKPVTPTFALIAYAVRGTV